ncbi:ATP-binding protein [Sphingomonas sp. DG1-23]|uniref:sensor histidine kinase n=1 Tax=Sphingomonas sp. DG1-23 TaxID=3068316 RepID=UPI00273FEABD|nr:ATP-binding protein [Sphingomonas sp. DG1-23]MDP5277459.1 ATP-binding protein [Sphingomonas sp. DG1-23]
MIGFQDRNARDCEILPPIGDRSRPGGAPAIAAAGVVHDLGNLIQIATSAINIIARTPEMPAIHAGPMLDRARTCLEHAGALVRQNLGRIRDTGETRSDLVACLADVAALVEALDHPGLVLTLDVEPGLPAAQCDPIELRRAVLNLVFNARDAMAGGGRIAIRARRVGHAGAMIGLEVADQGVGMSPETVARAFDPFFTTKQDGLGGIGLPMVEQFVRTADGDVAIASERGIGTVVTLRLPAAVPPDPHAEESRP